MGNSALTRTRNRTRTNLYLQTAGFTRQNKTKNSQIGWEMTEIWAKQGSLNDLIISQSFLNRFGCFWACFKCRVYAHCDPYPYPPHPYPDTHAGLKTRDMH